MSAPAARSHSGRCSATHFGAGQTARLLVGGAGEQDVAPETRDRVARRVEAGRAGLRREEPDDGQLHRDHRLHVDRAAPVDVAVDEVGPERVVRPALRRGRDHVEVREQQERLAAAAVAAQADMDGAAPGRRLDDLGFEPGVQQGGRDPARGEELAIGCLRPAAD